MSTLIRRYRANPIECGILCALSLVFCNSLYNLFFDFDGVRAAPRNPARNTASSPNPADRPMATSPQSLQSVELKCKESENDGDWNAAKVRLTGPLCGAETANDWTNLAKASVTYSANKIPVMVFPDVSKGSFSTEYIPLNTGRNSIHVEFSYHNGKLFSQDIIITKN